VDLAGLGLILDKDVLGFELPSHACRILRSVVITVFPTTETRLPRKWAAFALPGGELAGSNCPITLKGQIYIEVLT
jgi:hypothetical protein